MKASELSCALLLAAAVLSLGCSGSDSFVNPSPEITGSGTIVTETRPVAAFHSVDLRAVADVSFGQGGAQAVQIETDDNIIGHISTTVSNGVLTIDQDVDYTTLHGVIVSLDMTQVQALSLSGVGEIVGRNNIGSTDLSLSVGGVGEISLSGTADTLTATIDGTGDIHAQFLQTHFATIVISGMGDCWITVTDELDVTISGIGDVYYAGNPPVVNSDVTGTGSLIPL